MPTEVDWNIVFCSGYIVPPCSHLEHEQALKAVQGSSFNLDASIRSYFYPRFVDSPKTCTVAIGFTHTDGVQQNDVRDLIRALAEGDSTARTLASRALAARLRCATDQRSPTGLFVTLVGLTEQLQRIMVFKFPADESLQATFADEGLSIKLIDGAFSRKTDFFKASTIREWPYER